MLKNKNFILTVILPIVISIIIASVLIILNSQGILNTKATNTVKREMEQMSDDISRLEDEKESLTYTASQYDKDINDNQILVEEISALQEEYNTYNGEVESANKTLAELDKIIADKTSYNNSLNNISSQVAGQPVSYTDVKLNVPSDIQAGRYKAEGSGKLYIYTIAGTIEDSQNLALLDTKSYLFDIHSGQYIKIEGTLTLANITE